MKIAGIILIVLGIVGFILGGITYTRSEEVVDVGPLEVNRKESRTIPITPLASGAAVVGGIVLVAVGSRRK